MIIEVPPEVYEFNTLSYRNSTTHKKCRHKKWYQWFLKPHFRNVRRRSRERALADCEVIGRTENSKHSTVSATMGASNSALSVSHESIHDFSTPVLNIRKVRIDEVPFEIGRTSSESGIDVTITNTPNTDRIMYDLLENGCPHRDAEGDEDDDDDEDDDTTLLVPSSDDRSLRTSNRDSFVSADDFQSMSSLISEEYTPSVTTASMKSVYYSLKSETNSLIQIWQPEGEACS